MRAAPLAALLATLTTMNAAQAQPLAPVTDPETESRAAVAFLERLDPHDRPFVRFGSTYDVPPAQRPEFEKLAKLWWRQLTLNSNRRSLPVRVPGSGTLYWFDLRSFNWNDAAWRTVATRDKAFREPWVQPPTAQRLRHLIGEDQPANFHAVALVSMWGLYRRTYQTLETSDYYDLLFAEQRFPPLPGQFERREVLKYHPGGVDPVDGKEAPAGWYEYLVPFQKRGFVDFPKSYDQWLTAFLPGLNAEQYQAAVTKLKARRGAVVKGMEDTKGGYKSFVAKNNREAWVEQLPGALGSVFSQTFDVKETSGKRDLEENAFTDQHRDAKRVFRDGGELLATLPAGDGLAALVINAKGERVEVVPADIAIHTRDPRDRTVRNGVMVCYACHADAYGWVPLLNTIEKDSPDETDVRFQKLYDGRWVKDRAAAEDYDGFFIGWQDGLKSSREIMKANWSQATGTRAKDYKDGLTGAQVGSQSLAWKHRYDDALSMEQMVLETGAPEPFLRIAASRLTHRRTVDAVRKAEVPRPAWDKDVFPELMKVLSSRREKLAP